MRRENIKAGEEETLEDNDMVSYEVFEGSTVILPPLPTPAARRRP